MNNNEFWVVNQILLENMRKVGIVKEVEMANSQAKEIEKSDLKEIKGIGEKTLSILIDNGIRTIAQLKEKSKEEIESLITSPITRNQIFSYLNQAG